MGTDQRIKTIILVLVMALASCVTGIKVVAPAFAAADRASAIVDIGQKIASPEGLRIEVHGAGHPAGTYVGTYIYDNIFNAVQISLLTKDPAVRETMATLNRHDLIRVWGKLLDLDSPQPHVGITRMVIEKKYVYAGQPHRPEVDWKVLAKKLEGLETIVAEVHAVAEGGKLLVVDYQGFVFPIFNQEYSQQAKDLGRQDFVRLNFEIQTKPGRPIHFELVPDKDGTAIEVIDPIAVQHGSHKTLRGQLVLFPASPTIKFNVFAVKVAQPFGMTRTFTVINFDDPVLFGQIRKKLQGIWDQHQSEKAENSDCVFNDRNKFTNRCLEVEISGTINYVDPNQANPQMLVDRVENISEV